MNLLARAGIGLLLTAGLLSGTTTAASAAEARRTVKIKMVDAAFEPRTLDVAVGERVTFVFTNRGKADHDAFVGSSKAQIRHEREMRNASKSGHGGHGNSDTSALTVEPGERAKLSYTFNRAGTFEIGCHQPGHYTGGMTFSITVA